MQTYRGFPPKPLDRPVYLTVGSFDGIHLGHQALISRMAAAARTAGCLSGLLTFDPHPLAVLRPELKIARLTSDEERAEILEALGLDFLLVLPFSRETAATGAAEFIRDLTAHLPLRALWIGPDFALGRGREGSVERLGALGKEMGYKVRIFPPFAWRGDPVRSSRVRALLADEGAVAEAADLLGRPYQIWGQVQTGAHRGRSLGFPTANIGVPPDRLVPAYGVYACWAWLGEPGAGPGGTRGVPAVVNVGVRPTFDNGHASVEAYLLDFGNDLYGETMGLSFIRRLREERRFDSVPSLVAQIQADVRTAGRILTSPPDDTGARKGPVWEELPHTADRAIRVRGATQRQLFARAAAAMFSIEGADLARPITLARAVEMAADDTPALLVSWLNRLLLAGEVGGELYTRFKIYELSNRGLRGVIYGYPGAPEHTAVKAATFYDLDVTRAARGWTATLTFDV
jgi:riboflavin kinase / FMN adenylyltransferase